MTPHRLCSLVAVSLSLFAHAAAQAHGTPDIAPEPVSVTLDVPPNDYAKPETWLCRPGRDDACSVDLTANLSAVPAKAVRQAAPRPAKPLADCFYVYPTISSDPQGNADMTPGDEEARAAESQFARFGTVCRTFAPLYRQVTLRGLRARNLGDATLPIDDALPYKDVRDAWRHYLRRDNKGRPIVLIGHSQGARVLTQLLRDEIEGKPVHKQLVSALLIGSNFEVPRGKDMGASLQKTPLCRAAGQTGCVIAFVSFRATEGQPDNSRFGRNSPATEVACTNPAALGGGRAPLTSYFLARSGRMAEVVERAGLAANDAPYVALQGLVEAECVSTPEVTYLAVHHMPEAKNLRIEVPGDVRVGHRVLPDWGLHIAEVDLTMGNLVSVVQQQVQAFGKRSH